MILEIADIRIQPGQQAAFDEAIERGLQTIISKAKGFRGYRVNKGIESPERYLLMIFWERLENHTVDFRGSAAFAEWRAIVDRFFAQPPTVEHFTLLARSTGDWRRRRSRASRRGATALPEYRLAVTLPIRYLRLESDALL